MVSFTTNQASWVFESAGWWKRMFRKPWHIWYHADYVRTRSLRTYACSGCSSKSPVRKYEEFHVLKISAVTLCRGFRKLHYCYTNLDVKSPFFIPVCESSPGCIRLLKSRGSKVWPPERVPCGNTCFVNIGKHGGTWIAWETMICRSRGISCFTDNLVTGVRCTALHWVHSWKYEDQGIVWHQVHRVCKRRLSANHGMSDVVARTWNRVFCRQW